MSKSINFDDYHDIAEAIRFHSEPRTRKESYDRYTRESIWMLKDIGYLDCTFSPSDNDDIIYATKKGMEYCSFADKCDCFVDIMNALSALKEDPSKIDELDERLNAWPGATSS